MEEATCGLGPNSLAALPPWNARGHPRGHRPDWGPQTRAASEAGRHARLVARAPRLPATWFP